MSENTNEAKSQSEITLEEIIKRKIIKIIAAFERRDQRAFNK